MKTVYRRALLFLGIFGIVFVTGCPQPSGNSINSIIGSWESTNTAYLGDPDIYISPGAVITFASGTCSMDFWGVIVDDDTYLCYIDGTITPTNPDASATLALTVTSSDDEGAEQFVPPPGWVFNLINSDLTSAAVNIGVDMEPDGTIDFTFECIRQ